MPDIIQGGAKKCTTERQTLVGELCALLQCSAVYGWTQFAGVPPKAERPINKRYERLEPRRDFDKANWERVLVTF